MENKPHKQDELQPLDYFRNPAPSSQGSSPEDHSINNLRSEILTSSQLLPAKESFLRKINYKLIMGIVLAAVILGLILYIVVGSGRSRLEKSLIGLANIKNSPTPQSLQSPTRVYQVSATKRSVNPGTPLQPTKTPTRVKTASPTFTPLLPTPSLSPTFTQTSTNSPALTCRDAKSITLDDVGKILCVQGIIIETIEKPTNFMVIFSTDRGAFYWVSYDMVWTKGEAKKCYRITGKIDQIGISPMLIFDYNNIPQECP